MYEEIKDLTTDPQEIAYVLVEDSKLLWSCMLQKTVLYSYVNDAYVPLPVPSSAAMFMHAKC